MSKEMKRIAIITARGGSKRIPKKNIKEFCGKPMIQYSIEAALNSGIFDTVMVSTDSKEIAEISKGFGAEVPFFRSEKNSGDYATTTDVILEVIDEYGKRNINPDYVCCIYPTAPFVTPEILIKGMDLLQKTNVNLVLPVVPFSYPPQRGLVKNGQYVVMREPEYASSRSQDIETIFHDCGQFYCLNVEKLKETKNYMEGKIIPITVSEFDMQDIDNEDDWKLAELKYKMRQMGALNK